MTTCLCWLAPSNILKEIPRFPGTRLQYTYIERDEDRRLDSDERVKSEEVDVSRIILVNGVPFEQLLERNGRPPSPEEQRKQKEKFDKLKRETPPQRVERLRREAEEKSFS